MRERAASARNMSSWHELAAASKSCSGFKLPVALERRVAAEQKLGFRRRNEYAVRALVHLVAAGGGPFPGQLGSVGMGVRHCFSTSAGMAGQGSDD